MKLGLLAALVMGAMATACGPSVVLSDDDEGSAGDDTTTTTGPVTTSTVTTSTSTSTTTTVGPTTLDGTDDAPPPPLDFPDPPCGQGELGEQCSDPNDCCSNQCFVVGPLGGVCSECDEDADCEYGCTFGSPLDGTPAVCGDGLLGSGCETSEACELGLVCGSIVDIPGILESSTCGECSTDGDCGPGLLCGVTVTLETLGGFHHCVAPNTQPIDAACDLDGSGDAQCASGNCASTSIMGIPVLGVCSICDEDADCGGGTCVLPEVIIEGTTLTVESGFCQ